jgi:hypothetical protein
MPNYFTITDKDVSLDDLRSFLAQPHQIALSPQAQQKIIANRKFLEKKIAVPGARYYGINTGFGALCDVEIPNDQLEQLQENLLMSHACGMGEEVKPEVVKLMLLLKIKALAQGYSGVSLETVLQLVHLYNHNILPIVWEVGSSGRQWRFGSAITFVSAAYRQRERACKWRKDFGRCCASPCRATTHQTKIERRIGSYKRHTVYVRVGLLFADGSHPRF